MVINNLFGVWKVVLKGCVIGIGLNSIGVLDGLF